MAAYFCVRCGKEVEPHFSFCPYCGSKIELTQNKPQTYDTMEILSDIRRNLSEKPAQPPQEEILPVPDMPEEAPAEEPTLVSLRQRSLPDVSALYPDDEADQGSTGLRFAIALVVILLVVCCAVAALLWFNPFGWQPAPKPDLPAVTEPAATEEPAQPEASAEPEPTPEPEPEPQLPMEKEELTQLLREYYASYLECINQQNLEPLTRTTAGNKLRVEGRVLSETNSKSTFNTENFLLEPDWPSATLSNGVLMLNLEITFSSTLKGGSTPTISSNRQTYKLVFESDQWLVDQTGFVGEDDFAARKYAFLP